MVDLPAPVLPTRPTLSPASTLKLRPCKTSGRCLRYFSLTSLNSISPLSGHTWGSTSTSDVDFSYGQIFCIVNAHLARFRFLMR
jgi:hypothetical protein